MLHESSVCPGLFELTVVQVAIFCYLSVYVLSSVFLCQEIVIVIGVAQ